MPALGLTRRIDERRLAGRLAVVTGAGGGVGRAIATALSREGAELCAVGRTQASLADTLAASRIHSKATAFAADLTLEESLKPLIQYLAEEAGRVDILVHSAGVIHQKPMECARMEDLDHQYAVNVRAPYMLTQRLLPLLCSARGQIVFINSSAGLVAKRAEIGQYGATKHALKAIADSLREEVNPKGIRVLTMYVGRTATPMQEKIHKLEGRTFHAERLLQPEDVASVVVQVLTLPASAEVTDISIRPMCKT